MTFSSVFPASPPPHRKTKGLFFMSINHNIYDGLIGADSDSSIFYRHLDSGVCFWPACEKCVIFFRNSFDVLFRLDHRKIPTGNHRKINIPVSIIREPKGVRICLFCRVRDHSEINSQAAQSTSLSAAVVTREKYRVNRNVRLRWKKFFHLHVNCGRIWK